MGYEGKSKTDVLNHPLGGTFSFHRGEVGCLLLHGFTGTPWAMRTLGESLASQNVTVEAPLLSGHGTTPDDLNHVPWERWVDEASLSLERLESSCAMFFVIGLSMGGTIALYLASERNLKGVVTLSTPVALRYWTSHLLPLARPFVRSWKKKRNPAILWTPEMGYDRYPVGGAVEFFELMRAARKRLKDVRCPALIVHARGDSTVPAWNADVIYREIGSEKKQRVILEKPSHTITRGDNQKEVEKAVALFIQREIGERIE
jgi:carboxylesterase